MEQRIFNQPNKMYRGAMDASRMGNEKLPSDGIRSFSGSQYGQRLPDIRRDFQTNNIYRKSTLEDTRTNHLRQAESQLMKDNRSNVQNLDSLGNYQTNTWNSPATSSWNEWNPMISDLNSEVNYRRPSPEPDVRLEYRTSRNERSFNRNFRADSRGGMWQNSPERYQDNIDSNRSFSQAANIPSRFENNLRMQREPASSTRQDTFTRRENSTATLSLMETEGSLGYRSTASSGLTDIDLSLGFEPPPNYKLARNGEGVPHTLVRNETIKPLIPSLSRHRFEHPGTNLTVGSGCMGSSVGNIVTKPIDVPTRSQNRKRKIIPFHVRNRNIKKSKKVTRSPEVKDVEDLKDKKDLKDEKDLKDLNDEKDLIDLKYLFAVVPRNYPFQKATVEQIALLKNALIQEIEKNSDESLVSQTVRCCRLRGALMVFWNNDNGVECLKKMVKTLKPWDGANLKVIQQGPRAFTWAVIVANEFPNKYMTPEQWNAIYGALTDKMNEVTDDKQPQFIDSHPRRGTILVAYGEQKDFEWLKNTVQELQPWEGAHLRLLDIEDMPSYSRIEVTLPFPVMDISDFDTLLARLGRDNQGLDTSDWYLFDRRIKQYGRKLLVAVKDDVIEALERINYEPFLKLKTITKRITVVNLGKIKKIPFGESGYEEELINLKMTPLINQPKPDGDVGVVK